MTIHELKIEPQYLDALLDGSKRCEIRKNDRGYKVGDRLVLYDGKREFWVDVLRVDDFKQVEDYVVMSVVRTRGRGCRYCKDQQERVGKVEVTLRLKHIFKGYNFCPICGRRLDDVWQEEI